MEDFDGPLTRCPLCGSAGIELYDTDYVNRTIYRCGECRIRFLNPQYSDEYLKKLYSGYGYAGAPDAHGRGEDDTMLEKRKEIHHYYLSLVERYTPPGKFLSVGCGDGFEIRIARSRGWDAEGCDIDTAAIERTKEQGFKVYAGNLHEIDFGTVAYDCIYLHHVLEHPKNPQDYLRKIRQLLTPSGILFVASPNVSSISSSLKTLQARLRLNKRPMKHYDTWHHLFYYTPSKLKRLLEDQYEYEVLLTHCGLDDRHHRFSLPDTLTRKVGGLTSLKSKFVLICRRAPSAS